MRDFIGFIHGGTINARAIPGAKEVTARVHMASSRAHTRMASELLSNFFFFTFNQDFPHSYAKEAQFSGISFL
jgi:hypothetical protein